VNGQVDCLGILNGNNLPGTACQDSTGVGTWDANCTCSTSTSVQEFIQPIAELVLAPNPVNNLLTVNLVSGSAGTATMQIYELTGKQVSVTVLNLTIGQNKTALSTDDLQEGVYILKVAHDGAAITKRFVKMVR